MDRSFEELLVRLADGTLAPDERAGALERVAREERGQQALAVQRQARDALRLTAEVFAPDAFRTRIRTLEAAADRRPTRRRLALPRPGLAGAVAVACAAVAALVVALIPGAPGTDARVLSLAVVSIRPLAAPAPPPADDPALLRASFDGVKFPRWDDEFGWYAVGRRADVVGGRRTNTVFYLHEGHRIGYTIVAGAALRLPTNGRRVATASGPVYLFAPSDREVETPEPLLEHGGGFQVAVFERNGRTCVLSGVVHRPSTLVELASWQGSPALTSEAEIRVRDLPQPAA